MTERKFRPLPDVKAVMAGLRMLAAEQCRNNDFRRGYYTQQAIIRDHPEQFVGIPLPELLPVGEVPIQKPKTVYEPEKPIWQTKQSKGIEL